jgi:hypothetical protein
MPEDSLAYIGVSGEHKLSRVYYLRLRDARDNTIIGVLVQFYASNVMNILGLFK